MENIDEVILFCSSVSQACIPVIQMIQQYQLPVKLVRLDTASFREAVKNGPYFQIKIVPTLIVTYRDGNLRQFVGQPKTLEWLRMAVRPPGAPVDAPGAPAPPEMQPVPSNRIKGTKVSLPSYSSEEEEEFIPPKKKKGSKKRDKKRDKKSKSSSSSPHLSIKEGGLYGPSKKKKKEPTVEFYSSDEDEDEDEMDIEFIDDEHPSAPPTEGLMVGAHAVKPSRMKGSSIAEMAKQMERDRIKTLGYEERNLPVHN